PTRPRRKTSRRSNSSSGSSTPCGCREIERGSRAAETPITPRTALARRPGLEVRDLMHSCTLWLLLLSGFMDPPPREGAWPQWRGPSGDSVVAGPRPPTHWTKEEGVAWRTALPGWGNSTPVVWGDAIFLTAQEDDR